MTTIKETKELLEFGFNLQDAIRTSNSDGKITIMDAPNFFPVLMAGVRGIGGIQLVGAELLDLEDAEKNELIEFARETFNLPDDQLEILIEDTIAFLLDAAKLASRWGSYRK